MSDLIATISKICDKDKSKRRIGGKELENIIKKHIKTKKEKEIKNIINTLNTEFISSIYPNYRIGGLWGMACCCIVLFSYVKKHKIEHYLNLCVKPVLKALGDKNKNVRFSGIESLYNIGKNCRHSILYLFNLIFDAMSKLAGDGNPIVQNGNSLLTRLMKDIVLESSGISSKKKNSYFKLENFVTLLSDRIYSVNVYVRQFLIGWIEVIQNSPNFDLVPFLPKFLDGLFKMLTDDNKQIILQTECILDEFLRLLIINENEGNRMLYFIEIVPILMVNAQSNKDINARRISLKWIRLFLVKGKEEIVMKFGAQLLSVILPNVSHENLKLREYSEASNTELMNIVRSISMEKKKEEEDSIIKFDKYIYLVKQELEMNFHKNSRIVSLKWIHVLLKKDAKQVLEHRDELFKALINALRDPNKVIEQLVLEVLAIIGTTEENFKFFIANLISSFCTDEHLFKKSASVIKKLSLLLNPENLFVEISNILSSESFYKENFKFCREFVGQLNLILLTSKELLELRYLIAKSRTSKEGSNLFISLFKSWCHNPICVISLSLLSETYKLASKLIIKFSEMEVTVKLLLEIDHVVQLLESPVFARLRLKLLEPNKYPYLIKTLYGILMLLPQSTAYEKLSNRLKFTNSLILVDNIIEKRDKDAKVVNKKEQDELLTIFSKIKEEHENVTLRKMSTK